MRLIVFLKTHVMQKYLIIIVISMLFSNAAISQQCDVNNKKAQKQYDNAMFYYSSRLGEDKRKAIKQLHDIVKNHEEFYPAAYTLGVIYKDKSIEAYKMISQTKSLNDMYKYENLSKSYFIKSAKLCDEYKNYDAVYQAGKIYYDQHDYEKALKWFDIFKQKGQKHKDYALGKNMYERCDSYMSLITNPVDYDPAQVEGVSTISDEFLPLISPDGEYIFYTRRVRKYDKNEATSTLVDEFTYSKRTNSMEELKPDFSQGYMMPPPFNKGQDQGAISISIDNNHLYLTICKQVKRRNPQEGQTPTFKNCDIYVSHNRGGDWSEPLNLGPNINGRYSWESQPSISADGKTLYFASMRPTNIGFEVEEPATYNIDIYCSHQDESGNWGPAQNIGETINTIGNDKSPFMHSDSQTLYFATDGRFGVGGYDIYYSKKEQDCSWTQPKNIGYPINSESDEVGLIVSTNGEKAYFSSNKLDKGSSYNVYSFDLYEDARPKRVFFAKGTALDEENNVIEGAKIQIRSTLTDIVTEALVDSTTGNYAIAVALEDENEELLMTVKKEDYAFASVYIKPKKEELLTVPTRINFEMKKVEIGTKVEIKNIYYATNSAIFDKASSFVLDNFVDYLQDNPKIKIEIDGHTDNIGDADANQVLSKKRAKAVRDYLLMMGISTERIVAYKGFGQTKPIAPNNTEEGRAKNRRTEFVIVAK